MCLLKFGIICIGNVFYWNGYCLDGDMFGVVDLFVEVFLLFDV